MSFNQIQNLEFVLFEHTKEFILLDISAIEQKLKIPLIMRSYSEIKDEKIRVPFNVGRTIIKHEKGVVNP